MIFFSLRANTIIRDFCVILTLFSYGLLLAILAHNLGIIDGIKDELASRMVIYIAVLILD
jgi:hypothetical protein